jgi:hypothetical protein
MTVKIGKVGCYMLQRYKIILYQRTMMRRPKPPLNAYHQYKGLNSIDLTPGSMADVREKEKICNML